MMKVTLAERLRTLLPHMITPCVRCGNAAGFWVYGASHATARRPWCLSCLDSAGLEDIRAVPFEP